MSKLVLMLIVAVSCALAACSTIEGVGQDLSDGARWTRGQM